MKTLKYFATILLTATIAAGFSSCSKDDGDEPEHGSGELWNGSFTPPEYENEAAAFTITDSDAPYSFIELTSSGSYIVKRNLDNYGYQYGNFSRKSVKRSVFQKKAVLSRDFWDDIIYGDFVKQGPGKYSLDGFGTIIVNTDGTITIMNSEVGILTMNVELENPVEATELNNRFCRSWYVLYGSVELRDSKGQLLYSVEFKDPEDVQAEYVKYITVTKYGTFFQVDWDNTVEDTGKWRWKNTGKQIFQYKWDEYDTINYVEWGILQVGFNGQNASFIESARVEYDDEIEDYFGDINTAGVHTIVFKTTCKGV